VLKKPTVSMVIPTHNRGDSFVRALDSCLAQTYPFAEIVVSDHNSTDDTREITHEYMKRDPRISYHFWDERACITMNWILGATMSQGEWIKYVFDDDWLEPRCIEALLDNAHEDTLVSQCGATFEPSGQVAYSVLQPGWSIPTMVRHGILSVSPVTAIHKRDALFKSFDLIALLPDVAFRSGVGPNVMMNYGMVVKDESLHRHIPNVLVRLGGDDLPGEARSLTSRLRESDPELLYGTHAAAYDVLDRLAGQ
jgi:glycosyltransferase involved in cell wall biosynthesis